MTRLTSNCFVILLVLLTLSCANPQVSQNKEGIESDDFKLSLVDNLKGIDSSQLLSFNCELVLAKPRELSPFCADFGVAIWEIEWITWEAAGAIGEGIYRTNDCLPDCSVGEIYAAPVQLKLDGLYTDGSRYFLRHLTYTARNLLPLSETNEGTWDLAEFYIESPHMRSDRGKQN